MGGISKCGDAMMRTVLFEAAQSMLTRTIKWSWLKAWGMKIEVGPFFETVWRLG
jgi:transposase